MLLHLMEHPDRSVSELAAVAGMRVAVASPHLRALNARGLLQVERRGRWVCYRPGPDVAMPGSALILGAIKQTVDVEEEPVEAVYRQVTAFTHPRRVAIVRALVGGPLTSRQLQQRTRISLRALCRHLRKLADRGIVMTDGPTFRCGVPDRVLSRVLLELAREP